MTWFKIDTTQHADPSWVALPPNSRAVWLAMMSFATANESGTVTPEQQHVVHQHCFPEMRHVVFDQSMRVLARDNRWLINAAAGSYMVAQFGRNQINAEAGTGVVDKAKRRVLGDPSEEGRLMAGATRIYLDRSTTEGGELNLSDDVRLVVEHGSAKSLTIGVTPEGHIEVRSSGFGESRRLALMPISTNVVRIETQAGF